MQLDRTVELASVPNVRDLGGLRTSKGETLQYNRIIRGSAPAAITETDLATLVEDHSVSKFVDLRSPEEFAADRSLVATASGVRRVNAPIVDHNHQTLAALSVRTNTPFDAETAARHVLDSPNRVALAMRELADGSDGAIYVHCTVGQDRTGLIVALILSCVDVPVDHIAEDYQQTERSVDAIFKMFSRRHSDYEKVMSSVDPEVLASVKSAPSEDIHRIFAMMEREYAPAVQYVRNLTGGSEIIHGLRQKLIG